MDSVWLLYLGPNSDILEEMRGCSDGFSQLKRYHPSGLDYLSGGGKRSGFAEGLNMNLVKRTLVRQ